MHFKITKSQEKVSDIQRCTQTSETSLFLEESTAYADKQRRESAVSFLDKAARESSAFKILLEGFTGLAAQLRTPTQICHRLLRVK